MLSLIMFSALVAVFLGFVQVGFHEYYGGLNFVANVFIRMMISGVFLVLSAKHLMLRVSLGQRGVFWWLHYLAIPYLVLFWVSGYRAALIASDDAVLYSAIVVMVFFYVFGLRIIDCVDGLVHLNDGDVRLFSHYPPRKRSDMFLVDVAYLVFCSLPLLFFPLQDGVF